MNESFYARKAKGIPKYSIYLTCEHRQTKSKGRVLTDVGAFTYSVFIVSCMRWAVGAHTVITNNTASQHRGIAVFVVVHEKSLSPWSCVASTGIVYRMDHYRQALMPWLRLCFISLVPTMKFGGRIYCRLSYHTTRHGVVPSTTARQLRLNWCICRLTTGQAVTSQLPRPVQECGMFIVYALSMPAISTFVRHDRRNSLILNFI